MKTVEKLIKLMTVEVLMKVIECHGAYIKVLNNNVFMYMEYC